MNKQNQLVMSKLTPEQQQKVNRISYPRNGYEIIRFEPGKEYVAVWVKYTEGVIQDKIMIFEADVWWDCESPIPHFGTLDSPLARFVPTEDGWALCMILFHAMESFQ